jgi:hypothetical protein
MHKMIPGFMVVFFGLGCALLWWMLTLVLQATQRFLPGFRVPPFTSLCISLRPALIILPISAVACCVYAWARRIESREAWLGFFAALVMALQLMMLPVVIAAWLPLLNIIEKIGSK